MSTEDVEMLIIGFAERPSGNHHVIFALITVHHPSEFLPFCIPNNYFCINWRWTPKIGQPERKLSSDVSF
jgi:hypothetical protein